MDEKKSEPNNEKEKEKWEMSPDELLEAQLSGKLLNNSEKEIPKKEELIDSPIIKEENNDLLTQKLDNELSKNIVSEPKNNDLVNSIEPNNVFIENKNITKESETKIEIKINSMPEFKTNKLLIEENKELEADKLETKADEITNEDIFVNEDAKQDEIPKTEPIKILTKTQEVKPITNAQEETEKLILGPTLFEENHNLLIIPSWGKIIGYPPMGHYVNESKSVMKISADPVIFFGVLEARVETTKGFEYYLFGSGILKLRFQLEDGNYIVDQREINGLVLSDFVYDNLVSDKQVSLENDYDVLYNESVIKIPFNLSHKSNSRKTFISGILARNAFIPFKDIFLEIFDKINTTQNNNYIFNNTGYLLLSATEKNFNKILTSDIMKLNERYFNVTAEIGTPIPIAEEIMDNKFHDFDQTKITSAISKLYDAMKNLEFDSANLMTITENLGAKLNSKSIHTTSVGAINPNTGTSKESLFECAKEQLNDFKQWPLTIERNKKWDTEETSNNQSESPAFYKNKLMDKAYTPSAGFEEDNEIDIGDYQPTIEKQEKFELRLKQHTSVERKPLPEPPIVTGEDKSSKVVIEILEYVKNIIEDDYEMCAVGKAFDIARENLRKIMLQSNYMWEMSKYANQYIRREIGVGLNLHDKNKLLNRINTWISDIKKEEIEKQRILQEQREKERIEKEKAERERLERERIEREKSEKERLEKERIEREKEESHRQKLKEIHEKAEKERVEFEKKKKEQEELDRLAKEERELERLRKEQEEFKQKIKEEKQKMKEEKKKQKKLEKERKKLEKLQKKKEKLAKS